MPPRLHIDVTCLWTRQGRPVGISRIVAELARVVRDLSEDNQAWRYDRDRRRLIALSWAEVTRLTEAGPPPQNIVHRLRTQSLSGLNHMRRQVSRARAFPDFGADDRFVFADFIDSPHRIATYRTMLAETGVATIFYCHDLVPLLFADTVEPVSAMWFAAVLELFSMGAVLCNSHATRRDLHAAVPDCGLTTVVSPGSELIRAGGTPIMGHPIAPNYILYVSTIEPRKNHRVLLDAYDILLRQGRTDLPPLVFVGERGWRVSGLLREIDHATGAAAYATILERVGDADLRALYAHARFTVYPSWYEGWGMPVGEALGLGNVVLSSDRGALPEAGAGFSELIDPGDASHWAARIAHYLDHPDALHAQKRKIAETYRPRSWAMFRHEAGEALRHA